MARAVQSDRHFGHMLRLTCWVCEPCGDASWQMDAHVEISGGEQGDAFAELVSMAIQVDPTLADRGASTLAGSRGASASVVGAHSHYANSLGLGDTAIVSTDHMFQASTTGTYG